MSDVTRRGGGVSGWVVGLAVAGVLAGAGGVASGYDFVKNTSPTKWIRPHLPEELPKLDFPEYFTPLEKARELAFRGRYKGSLVQLREVKEGKAADVAVIKASALAGLGRDGESIEVLADEAVAGDERVGLLRARVLAKTGKVEEARAALRAHLERHPGSIAGHYWAGVVAEMAGDAAAAEEAYGWFNNDKDRLLDKWRGNPEQAPFDRAENVVLIGRGLDRLALLKGLYKDNRQLHDDILAMFVRAYDVVDRGYWPAHVAAARYFLAHDQPKEAQQELQVALEANPNDAEALLMVGEVAVDHFDFDKADRAIAAIRDSDPGSMDADLLECRSLLRQRRPKEAEALARKVIAGRPRDLTAMGLLGGSLMLQLRDDEAKQVLRQVESVDPDNATAYYEVAEQLSAMRQYPRAAAMYQVAIDRAPWWTDAKNSLGLLYTQSGEEDKARAVLDAAHAIDPFNLRTTNYLRLLDELAAYDRAETPHFTVVYDGSVDPVIPEYFGEYLEGVYPQVTRKFRAEPPEKTVIEVFPTHDAFSVRTTGSPWIGTVGASTGPVIALVSPRKGPGTKGPFNWSQVLRHEFTHTVTLAATDNRIAHWMTEGLAVVEEEAPMPWEWVPMLFRAVKEKELLSLEELTWAFIRPKKPSDRQMAYAQSAWVCQYIEQVWGHDAVLAMMQGFRDGKSQDQVFPEVLRKSTTEFSADFERWAEAEVAKWGYDEQTSDRYDELRKKGEVLVKGRQYAEAVEAWEEIARIRPVDPLPHQRLAGLYLTKDVNEPRKAIDHLLALSKVDLHDNRYAKRVARLYRDMGEMKDARAFATKAVYIDPYDLDAHELLAEVCEKVGDQKGLDRERRVIPVLSKWIEENRRKSEIPSE